MAFDYQPNSDFRTSRGNIAPDFHLVSADYNAQQKAEIRRAVEQQFPGARVVQDATGTYNCHSYAHAQGHAWFNDITRFIEDDYYPFTPGTLRVDDIVVYVKNNSITHSGVIKQLSGNTIIEIRSKWGPAPQVVHGPTNVPADYGSIVYYLRRRGTLLVDTVEPSAEDLRSKVEDLIYSLTRSERLSLLEFASTPDMVRTIIAQIPEISELSLYGSIAGEAIVGLLANAESEELAILSYAVERLGYTEALSILANRVAELSDDGTVSFLEDMALSAFESLSLKMSNDRKSRLIKSAIEIKLSL